MRLKKGILCICMLVTVLCSTVGAAAKKASPTGNDIWKYGTTGLFGGGTVYSEYVNWKAPKWYKASVKNAKGVYRCQFQYNGSTYAKASVNAYAGRTDYSYYDYK